MYKGKTILGLIPARGGSKGLPGKNIKPMCGKPLVAWTIEKAKKSKYFDKVIVSTDDSQIADISKKYGAEIPFLRPAELAADHASSMDVIFHALDYFKTKGVVFDAVALLEPTSPLREDKDIDQAIELLYSNEDKIDSVVSVGEVQLEHPAIVKVIANGYVKPYDDSWGKVTRRQELSKVYFPYGVIYIATTKSLRVAKTFYQEKTKPYFIERWQNYEIDDLYDFMNIETILKHRIEKEGAL